MIVRAPALDDRAEQPYAGFRAQIPMSDLPVFIPGNIERVFGWLGQRTIAPAGAPFMRYWVLAMPGRLDVEIGVPTASVVNAADGIEAGTLPGGRYASLIYRDVTAGIEGNAALLEWIASSGAAPDRWDDPHGEAFAARYERFLSGPADKCGWRYRRPRDCRSGPLSITRCQWGR